MWYAFVSSKPPQSKDTNGLSSIELDKFFLFNVRMKVITAFAVKLPLVSPSARTCRAAREGQHQLSTFQIAVRRTIRETGSERLKLSWK